MLTIRVECCCIFLNLYGWTLRSSLLIVFNNFLLIDAIDRSKINSDQKRFFIALSVYPLTFFANTPFKVKPDLKMYATFHSSLYLCVSIINIHIDIISLNITVFKFRFLRNRSIMHNLSHGSVNISHTLVLSFYTLHSMDSLNHS